MIRTAHTTEPGRLPRVGAFAAATLAAVLGVGHPAIAQDAVGLVTAERAPRFLAAVGGRTAPVAVDPDRTPVLRARIAVDVRGQSVAAAVETIARAAGLRLYYSAEALPADRRATLQATGISVASALSDVLMGTDLDVLLSRTGQAMLVRREASDARQAATVSGQVTDSASRRPLAGARLALAGTSLSATTNDAGRYRIAGVPAGRYTLTVRRLGYAPARRPLAVEGGQDVTADVRLAVSSSVLDQVVVTGTVVPTERRALPNAITVIDSVQIARRNITNVTELFRGEVPGLYAWNTGVAVIPNAGPNQPGNQLGQDVTYARGSSTIDGSSSPLKVYVDGVEQANNNYLSTLDPKMIARVEILTGPQASTIYGAQAINGVMQVFTKRGAFNSRPRVTAQLGYGMIQNNYSSSLAPSHDHALQVSGGLQNISYQVGGSYTSTGQWSPGNYQRSPIGSGGLRYESQRAHLSVDLSARFAYRDIGVGPGNPVLAEDALAGRASYSAFAFVPSNYQVANTQQTLGVTLRHTPARWWTQTATVGNDQLRASFARDRPGYVTSSDTLLSVQQQDQRKTSVTYNSTFTAALGRWLGGNLTVGGDYWTAPAFSAQFTTPVTTGTLDVSAPGISRVNDENRGFYGQAQIAVADLVYLTVGSRWDKNANYGQDFGYSQAPRYGVSLARTIAGVTAKVRASYGRSIRPPTVNQRNAIFARADPDYAPHNEQLANRELGPEQQRGWEQGVELAVGPRLSVSVSHYDQTVENLIGELYIDSVRSLSANASGEYNYGRISQNQNIGDIRNRGWEATATATYWRLTARGTVTSAQSRIARLDPRLRYSQTALGVGDQYGSIPEHSGAVNLTYAAPRTTLTLTTSITGQVRRSLFATPLFIDITRGRFGFNAPDLPRTPGSLPIERFQFLPRPGYSVTDLNVSQQLGRGLEGFVRVRNLGDQYTDNDFSVTYPVQGRTTLLGLRRTW